MKARTVSFFQAPLRASCMTLEAPNSTFSEQADDAPSADADATHCAHRVCAFGCEIRAHVCVACYGVGMFASFPRLLTNNCLLL